MSGFTSTRQIQGAPTNVNIAMLIESEKLATIFPGFDERLTKGFSRFRWAMHACLPYPFPSAKCVEREATIGDHNYKISFHNHYNRVIVKRGCPVHGPIYFSFALEDERSPITDITGAYPGAIEVSREHLPCLVSFAELSDHSAPADAVKGADAKIGACFGYLSSFLAACQPGPLSDFMDDLSNIKIRSRHDLPRG